MAAHQHPDEPLSLYLRDARRYAYLDVEAEGDLARRWHAHGDARALERLVGSHLRLVFNIAKRFRGYGLPLADLVAEGNVGLMQAARKFDPDKGFRFATYAMWWIKAAIQEHVLHNWSLVKIGTTAAQKKLFFNLRRMKAQMRELEAGDLPADAVDAIAAELGVAPGEVVDMNRRLGGDSSLNAPVGEDGDGEWQNMLADDRIDQETLLAEAQERRERIDFLKLGLEKLDDRERSIIVARHLTEEPRTLEDLSRQFNVSRERIRQIESRAIEKVRKVVRTAAAPAAAGRC